MENSQDIFSDEDLEDALVKSQGYGFLSPQPISGQITHSKEFISLVPEFKGIALDLGAGGGLPCLVWLNQDPVIQITALDAMNKRTNFLSEVIDKHESLINRFSVVNGRAEELAHDTKQREKYDVVVARGFGPPAITAECASGFIKPGGSLVVSGRPENEILRWNEKGLMKVGLSISEVREAKQCHAIILKKTGLLSDEYPRNTASMKKKPLW